MENLVCEHESWPHMKNLGKKEKIAEYLGQLKIEVNRTTQILYYILPKRP